MLRGFIYMGISSAPYWVKRSHKDRTMFALSGKIAEGVTFLAILAILIVISYFDIKIKKIPDFSAAALMLMALVAILLRPSGGFLNHVAGFFAVSVPMALCASFIPGAFGGGDIKMMAAAGFLLGFPSVCAAFCEGILFAGGLALFVYIIKGRNAKIPMGPFLCLGILAEAVKKFVVPC